MRVICDTEEKLKTIEEILIYFPQRIIYIDWDFDITHNDVWINFFWVDENDNKISKIEICSSLVALKNYSDGIIFRCNSLVKDFFDKMSSSNFCNVWSQYKENDSLYGKFVSFSLIESLDRNDIEFKIDNDLASEGDYSEAIYCDIKSIYGPKHPDGSVTETDNGFTFNITQPIKAKMEYWGEKMQNGYKDILLNIKWNIEVANEIYKEACKDIPDSVRLVYEIEGDDLSV